MSSQISYVKTRLPIAAFFIYFALNAIIYLSLNQYAFRGWIVFNTPGQGTLLQAALCLIGFFVLKMIRSAFKVLAAQNNPRSKQFGIMFAAAILMFACNVLLLFGVGLMELARFKGVVE